jgi:hypothetical protein
MKQANSLAVALVVLVVSFLPALAGADPQNPGQSTVQASDPSTPSRLTWLSAYRFHLTAASMRADDPRFNWDAHFGGDLDLLDYGIGRLNMVADYGVIIGSELRTIDPNQGAYHLGISTSWRSGPSEFQAIFDHVSRHLSDRANRTAVSWNAAGVAATARYGGRTTMATVRVSGAKVVQAAFVDYTWQFGVAVDTAYPLAPAVALVASGELAPTLVNRSIAGRDTQTAGRLEAGVRVRGKDGAVELFAAWERRVDPYPLERATGSWALLGFRLVNR